jgi:carbonic anhydrase
MALVDHLRAYNGRVPAAEIAHLAREPARHWAIVSCMDARLNLDEICALQTGEAHVLRNAGGVVTDDVIRSLVISSYVLGTNEFAAIAHTGCGLLTLDDREVQQAITRRTGTDASGLRLLAFHDLEAHVRDQVHALAASPFLARGLPISGWIFDLQSARLQEIASARTGEMAVRA